MEDDLDELARFADYHRHFSHLSRTPRRGTGFNIIALLFFTGILIGGILIAGLAADRLMHPPYTAQPVRAQAEAEDSDLGTYEYAVPTAAATLAWKYHQNEIAGEDAYRGRLLDISGTVTSVGRDIFGRAYVTLSGVGFSEVHCTFAGGRGVAALYRGQRVIIRGRCDRMILGDVMVDDCSLE